eukprot:COSAG02_NODE_9423_length_2221_cov_1.205938_2_plen_194_part_01
MVQAATEAPRGPQPECTRPEAAAPSTRHENSRRAVRGCEGARVRGREGAMVLSMLLRPAAAARPTAVVWRRAASWPTSAALLGRRSRVQLAGGSWRRRVASKAGEEDQWALGKAAFKGLYPQIIADINDDVAATGMPPSACAWVERMVNYTLPGGKLNRGTMVHLMYNEILSARGDCFFKQKTAYEIMSGDWSS